MTVSFLFSNVLTDIGNSKWVLKLCCQIIARHMKFLEDQVDSGASMGTERILFVIEDLYKF
jgi:hypothetical protein